MADNLKSNEESNLNNQTNQDNSQQNNESSENKKDEKKADSQNEKDENKELSVDAYNSAIKENINSASNNEKGKRHRRGKNETSAERTYKCPDCDKCYLSGPALVIHRKNKHGYNPEIEKKSRGRPKKEEQQENSFHNAQLKYDNFLNNSTRKKISENESEENGEINLDIIKDNLTNIFRQCKNDLFANIDEIDNYPFYQLVVNNWEKNNKELEEYFNDNKKNEAESENKISSPYLDQIFFLYLKEFATKTNKNYFWFINKFIVLFRECINSLKKDQIKEKYKNGTNKEYSQLFNAEGIPESCNDFFLEFMQPKQYYGLNEGELIELAQHFCFWLYMNKYTHSYLILL
jgi:hypothetical protein